LEEGYPVHNEKRERKEHITQDWRDGGTVEFNQLEVLEKVENLLGSGVQKTGCPGLGGGGKLDYSHWHKLESC